MKTETVTITHSNEGIRVIWPDCTVAGFSTPVYLAEAYAIVKRSQDRARNALVDVATEISGLISRVNEKIGSEVEGLREALLNIAEEMS